jgi:hypothetical protein
VVVYRHSRVLNASIKFAYDWCTDFSPEDAKIAGAKFPRIVLEKTRRRVVYASYKQGSDGKPKLAVRVVTLHPKAYSWHLDYFAEEDLEMGDYKLTKLGNEKTKLSLRLDNKWKKGRGPTKSEFESSTAHTWDKYAPALERDYRNSKRN